jgi:hypothetical protein
MANNEKENILLGEIVYRVSDLARIPLWRFVSPSNIKNLVSGVGEALDPHCPGHIGSLTIPADKNSSRYAWNKSAYTSKKEIDKIADELIEFTDALGNVHKLPRWQVKEVFASFDNEYQIVYTNEPYSADALNKKDLSSLKGKKVAIAYTDCGYLKLSFIHDFNGDPLTKQTEKGIGFLAIHQNEKTVANVYIDGTFFYKNQKGALFALEDNLAKFKKEQESAMTEQKKTTCSFGTKHQYNINFLVDKVPLWRLVSKSNIDKLINSSNELLKPSAPVFVGSLTHPARGNEWFWDGLFNKTTVQECANHKISFIDALGQRSTLPRWLVEEVIASFSDEYHIVVISDISKKSSFPNADSLKGKKVATFYQQYRYGKFHFQDNFQGNLEEEAEKGIGFLSVDLSQKETVSMVINGKPTTNIDEDKTKKLEIIHQIDDCCMETKKEEVAKMTKESIDEFPKENSVYIKDDFVFVRGVDKLIPVAGPHGFRVGKRILDVIPKERWKDIRVGYGGNNKEIDENSILIDGTYSTVKTVEDIKKLGENYINFIRVNDKSFLTTSGDLEKLKEEFVPAKPEEVCLENNTVYIEGDNVFVTSPKKFNSIATEKRGIFLDKDVLAAIPKERWKDIRIRYAGNNEEIDENSILIEGHVSTVRSISEIKTWVSSGVNKVSFVGTPKTSFTIEYADTEARASKLKEVSRLFNTKLERKTVKLGDLEIDEKWVEYLGKEIFDKFAVEIKPDEVQHDFAWKITFSDSSVWFRGDEGVKLISFDINAEKETVVKYVKDFIEKYNKSTTKVVKAESFFKNGMPKDFSGIVEYPSGSRGWYLNGKEHRVDGPAIERADGTKFWYLNGQQHREDGPAIEHPGGAKEWYLNGKLHRVDGPACEYSDGSKEWWLNGERHRADGPAIERANGTKLWWLNGKSYSESEWKVAVEKLKKSEPQVLELKAEENRPANYTGIVKWADGYKAWFLNGECHREDGPAHEYPDGTKEWYLNGKYHRVDGPAIEYANGSKLWYLNGKPHREDGPAKEYASGDREWWLKGKSYPTVADWKRAVDLMNEVPQSKIEAIKEIAISDAQIVAERIAAIKIAEAIQTMLVAALTSHLKNKKQKSELTEHLNKFFASDNGQIMIKFVLGTTAPMFVDHLPEKYHNLANKLSTELRVQAETSTATKLMETVMPTILKFAGDFIRVEDEGTAKIRVDVVEDNSSPQQTEQQEQELIQRNIPNTMLN